MSFKACIFDLDGTLCDSVESIACSANHALRDFGMKEATIEEYKVFVGDRGRYPDPTTAAFWRR